MRYHATAFRKQRSGQRLEVAFCAILSAVLAVPTSAQPPSSPPELPEIQIDADRQSHGDPAARRKIESALAGDEDAFSGDPILADVLELIRKRRGARQQFPLDDLENPSEIDVGPLPGIRANDRRSPHERFFVAEMLLRTARLLDQVAPGDKSREQLVSQMRKEAVRLLTINPSNESRTWTVPDSAPTHR